VPPSLSQAVDSCRCLGGVLKWAPPGNTPRLPAFSPPGGLVLGVQPFAQEAELVAFRVLQDVPLLFAGLPYIGRPRTEGQQTFQFGFLVAVHRVDVDMQRKPPHPRIAAGAQEDRGLETAESGVGRPNLYRTVLPVDLHITKDIAPEPCEQFGVGAVEDQFTDTA